MLDWKPEFPAACRGWSLSGANGIWAAGVRGAPFAENLGVDLDSSGRIQVNANLSIPGYSEVFMVGDLANMQNPKSGRAVPGVASAAIQMGLHAAKIIRSEVETGVRTPERAPFQYWDKGTMATTGRWLRSRVSMPLELSPECCGHWSISGC